MLHATDIMYMEVQLAAYGMCMWSLADLSSEVGHTSQAALTLEDTTQSTGTIVSIRTPIHMACM